MSAFDRGVVDGEYGFDGPQKDGLEIGFGRALGQVG
jgi:hypothetical protein